MSAPATTPKTKAERQAIFAQLFAGTAPAEQPTISRTEQIREYRAEILVYRAKGYSWEQIREKLKLPPLNIEASVATLIKAVTSKPRKKAERLPVIALPPRSTPAINAPAGTPATAVQAVKKL